MVNGVGTFSELDNSASPPPSGAGVDPLAVTISRAEPIECLNNLDRADTLSPPQNLGCLDNFNRVAKDPRRKN